MSSEYHPTSLVDLPTEILRDIIDYLPHNVRKGALVLPRNSQSNISSTSRRLRNLMLPSVYSSVILRSATDAAGLAAVVPYFGHFIKKLTIRWDFGGELKFHVGIDDGGRLGRDLGAVLKYCSKLEILVLDFPGAFVALEKGLKGIFEVIDQQGNADEVLQSLHTVKIRNGRCYLYPPNQHFLIPLSRLSALQSLSLEGNCKNDAVVMSSGGTVGHSGASMWQAAPVIQCPTTAITRPIFPSLTHLSVSSLAGFTDELLCHLLLFGGRAVDKLAIISCPMITLKGTVATLNIVGPNLVELDISILKHGKKDELLDFDEDEHLCPVIRERCTNVKVLSVHANKLCDQIFFAPAKRDGHVVSHGLVTPPASPGSNSSNHVYERTHNHPYGLTAPLTPLFNHATSSTSSLQSSLLGEALFPPKAPTPTEPTLYNVSLRIPYDYSSLCITNSGGPSLQQTDTQLCDGSKAEELLRFTERAMNEGLVGMCAKVTGWSKFGPHMLFKD